MTGTLGLRVRPARAAEPAHGLLMRLAARHRRADAKAFASELGLNLRALMCGRQTAALAAMAGLDEDSLRRWTPQVDHKGRTVVLRGEVLRLGDWSVARRRWCPDCLGEDAVVADEDGVPVAWAAVHRPWWDVGSIRTCPRHGTALAETCGACGQNPGWTGGIAHCRCGAALWRRCRTAGPHAAGAADRYLVGRLAGDPARAVAFLDRATLKDAVGILERLGLAAGGVWRPRKPRLSQAEAALARDTGHAVATVWPASFGDALDRTLADARARGTRPGLIGAYGWIYELWIEPLPEDGVGRDLKRALRDHAVRHGVIAGDEPALGFAPSRRVLNLSTAAARLGMGHVRARRVLARQGLVPPGARRSVAVPLGAAEVVALKTSLERTVDLRGLRAMLGIGKSQTTRLAGAGLIGCDVPSSVRGGFRRFPRDEVAAFLRRIMAGAPVRRTAPAGARPLPVTCRSVGVRIETACHAILSGGLRPAAVHPGLPSLAKVLVRPTEVRALRQDRLSIEQAAAGLAIHHEAARALNRLGLLGRRGPDGRPSLRRADVETFRRRYISGPDVARRLGTSARRAAELLAARGVAAAVTPPLCRQVFFERSDAERALAAGPAPAPRRPCRRGRVGGMRLCPSQARTHARRSRPSVTQGPPSPARRARLRPSRPSGGPAQPS